MSGQAYVGSSKRTFSEAVRYLLETEYGGMGGPRVSAMLSEDLESLVEQFFPAQDRVRPGWMVFTGTKAEGNKAYPGKEAGDYHLVTIAWPVLLKEDIEALFNTLPGRAGQKHHRQLRKRRLVRLIQHGWNHPQGPVLLTQADLGLMLEISHSTAGQLLREVREETGLKLPTKGYYFDQGMRPTHKAEIIALYEAGMDEADIARRSRHAPPSVGRYIRDYERVKLLKERQIDPLEMAPLTGLQPSVVKAYLKLLDEHRPDLFLENRRNVLSPS